MAITPCRRCGTDTHDVCVCPNCGSTDIENLVNTVMASQVGFEVREDKHNR